MARTWIDRIVQYPKRFMLIPNSDGTVTLDPQPGTITQSGTPVTATWLNGIESDIVSATKITDESTGSKYQWKIDNGQLYIEEVE